MKRRLKSELLQKKQFKGIEEDTEEAARFEESLLKLAQLAKGRIKLSDFSASDKQSLLDLFVNNEKTLLKIYEALFPHNTSNIIQGDNNLSYKSNEYMSVGTLLDNPKSSKLLDDQQYLANLKKNMEVLENYESNSRNQYISAKNLSLDNRNQTTLPSLHNQSFENENPYRTRLTRPSLLNQNVSF